MSGELEFPTNDSNNIIQHPNNLLDSFFCQLSSETTPPRSKKEKKTSSPTRTSNCPFCAAPHPPPLDRVSTMFFKSRADHSESDDLRPKKRSKDKASLSPSAPSPARIPEKLSKKHNVANDELMIGGIYMEWSMLQCGVVYHWISSSNNICVEFMYKGGPMYITQCYILYGKVW